MIRGEPRADERGEHRAGATPGGDRSVVNTLAPHRASAALNTRECRRMCWIVTIAVGRGVCDGPGLILTARRALARVTDSAALRPSSQDVDGGCHIEKSRAGQPREQIWRRGLGRLSPTRAI
jgi:hypothetical protein